MSYIPICIEDGYNTSYIDSVLIALFYKTNSYTDALLNKYTQNYSIIYLQELIKNKFIDALHKNFSINSCIINEIRNYSFVMGWDKYSSYLNELCSPINFFIFLNTLFEGDTINIEINQIKDGIFNTNNKFNSLQTIILNPTKNTSIRELFISWISDNIIGFDQNNMFNCYKLINIPNYICFDIKRNNEIYKIDLMKKIKFFSNSDPTQNYLTWIIHGIICYSGINYYSLIYCNNNWIEVNSSNIPSFKIIDLSDDDEIERIQTEVVFVIYILNKLLSDE
jgi:hypothetical protein